MPRDRRIHQGKFENPNQEINSDNPDSIMTISEENSKDMNESNCNELAGSSVGMNNVIEVDNTVDTEGKSENEEVLPVEMLPCAKELFLKGALTPTLLKNWGVPLANMGKVYLLVSQGDTSRKIGEDRAVLSTGGTPTVSTMSHEVAGMALAPISRDNGTPDDGLSSSSLSP